MAPHLESGLTAPAQRTVPPLDILDRLPRLGWAADPTPIQAMPELAAELGLGWLGCKRDDLTQPGSGGTKTRKLDFLLASPPWRDAPKWISVGAIGSGHLVACTAAAERLGRQLEAHLFWEPLSAGVLDNLAYTASGPTSLIYHSSRVALALRRPGVLTALHMAGVPVIPPGGTTPVAMLGLVRAGLELAGQVHRGELPEPQRVYVSLGSGGTAVGLAVGLAIGGLRTVVHAVAAVERALATRTRLRRQVHGLSEYLRQVGLPELADVEPNAVVINYSQVGPGYGRASGSSLDAVGVLKRQGIGLEPIYTGKAMAALLVDAEIARRENRPIDAWLFWNTVRRPEPMQVADGWRARLPPALIARLQNVEGLTGAHRAVKRSRRWFLVGGAATLAGATALVRMSGYPSLPRWHGREFTAAEAHILGAAAEAVLASAPLPTELTAIAVPLDRYVAALPPRMRSDIHALIWLIEQGSTPLVGQIHRMSSLPVAARVAYLKDLLPRRDVIGDAARGLRDLVVLGYYALPMAWGSIGFTGPLVPDMPRPRRPTYAQLVAPAGRLPNGMRTE